jgi:hypothetical protein
MLSGVIGRLRQNVKVGLWRAKGPWTVVTIRTPWLAFQLSLQPLPLLDTRPPMSTYGWIPPDANELMDWMFNGPPKPRGPRPVES